MFLPSGAPYAINRHSQTKCIYFNFVTEDCGDAAFAKLYPNSALFRDLFYAMLTLYSQRKINYQAEMMSMAYKIIAAIQYADSAGYLPQAHYKKLSPAIECISRDYCSGNLRVAQLADLCGISPRYFCQLFSVFFGVSPKEYILRMQVDSAKDMLINTDKAIGGIAAECGMGDVYYFSKAFKRSTGMSPTEYRRSNEIL